MKKIINKLNKAESVYNGVINSVEVSLADKIDFEFSIIYQSSDGFVILCEETNHNAPIKPCLEIIEKKGRLSFEDYMEYSI